ncbi:hypothetical protein [Modestobacter sp. DSM 44400]|uniref:hypothetical protein n=1 Tax=Modestobacter sp. DSM 44400 TaxID=1550230 RepID=UPI000B824A9C|nr:hypothetical protein [Modestobacter sp. DSM 44400]
MTSTTTGLPDRYRPISQVAPDEETTTGVIRSWRARDRVLNRDVALRVHTPGGPPAREWITRALTAGGLATPALSMVYDAAEGTGGDGPGGAAYVVNEWLEGQTLRHRLAESGPLPEREARALVRRLAEGVAEAHRVGLAVGGLTPEHVVLRPGGLAGLLSVPAATGTVQGDIAALGGLLELALTGRTGNDDTPPAIASPDLAALVRRARSGDPSTGLSSVATMVALLAERPRTGPQDQARPDAVGDSGWVRRLRDALPPVPGTSGPRPGGAGRWPVADDEDDLDWGTTFPDEGDVAEEEPTGRSARRRLAVIGLPLLALLMVIAFALWFGKNVLSVAGSVDEVQGSTPLAGAPASSSAGAPPPSADAAGPLPVTAASVFDPYGDGEPENDDDVPLSYDGDPATAWQTLGYRGSAEFGNLKPGVGVLYDLGSEQSVGAVTVLTTLPGTTVEVRTGDDPNGDLDSFPVAVSGELTGTDQFAFPSPVATRYVLVWITGLVQSDGNFTGSLAEVTPLAAG